MLPSNRAFKNDRSDYSLLRKQDECYLLHEVGKNYKVLNSNTVPVHNMRAQGGKQRCSSTHS